MCSGGAHVLRVQQAADVECGFIWTAVPELLRVLQPSPIISRYFLVITRDNRGGAIGDGVEGGEFGTPSGA